MRKKTINQFVEPYLPSLEKMHSLSEIIQLEIASRQNGRYSYAEKARKEIRDRAVKGETKLKVMFDAVHQCNPEAYLTLMHCDFQAVVNKGELASLIRFWAGESEKYNVINEFSDWFAYKSIITFPRYYRWRECRQPVRRRLAVVRGPLPKVFSEPDVLNEFEEVDIGTMSSDLSLLWCDMTAGNTNDMPSTTCYERSLFNLIIDVDDDKKVSETLRALSISLPMLEVFKALLENGIKHQESLKKITGDDPRFWLKSSHGYLFFCCSNPRNAFKAEGDLDDFEAMTPEATRIWRTRNNQNTTLLGGNIVEVSG